jgi:hypothetical protein
VLTIRQCSLSGGTEEGHLNPHAKQGYLVAGAAHEMHRIMASIRAQSTRRALCGHVPRQFWREPRLTLPVVLLGRVTHNTCLASWIGLPSAKPSRKITEVRDLFRFVAFLKVTLKWLPSVHSAPRAFSLGSQRTYLWTNVALACNASAKEGP